MRVDENKLKRNQALKDSLMRLIKEKGEVKSKEAYSILANEYGLNKDERLFPANTRSEPKWNNSVRRAKQELQDEGLVECKNGEDGLWVLTEAGESEVLKLIID